MNQKRRSLNRRTFLKRSAEASAAFAAALEAFRAQQALAEEVAREAAAQPVGRPVNIAIVGTGSEGKMLIGEAVKTPGVFCKAVCDIWPPSLDEALQTIRDQKTIADYRQGTDLADALKIAGQAKGYADYREMLEKERDVEAVIIATPLHLHSEMVSAAAAAGKHVYCEKMMAKTIEECKKIGRIARDGNKVVQFGHQQHWNDFYVTGYKLTRNDKICGRLTHMRAWWHRNKTWRRDVSDQEKSLVDVTRFGYRDVDRLRNWRMYWDTSGGLMSELACHQIAIANWYSDSVPTAVIGMGGHGTREDWGGEVYDNVQCIFQYPETRNLVYQSISTNCHDGQGEQFMGTDGTVLVSRMGGLVFQEPKAASPVWLQQAQTTKDPRGNTAIVIKADSSPGPSTQPGTALGAAGGQKKPDPYRDYRLALADWVACIRDGKKPKVDWQVALNAAVPCIMANVAMKEQRLVEIKPETYRL